ncbi:MAG: NADP-dependent oxidoreductase [Smithella sp.]
MKAVLIHKYGGPEKVVYENVAAIPKVGANQVLVQIKAVSLNPVDIKLASGKLRNLSLPWTPGGDFSGIAEAIGPGVFGFKNGDAVFGNSPGGGSYAQYIAIDTDFIVPMPPRLNFVEAASVPLAGQTAWQGILEHGELQAGQKALIHGAAGGVGSFAVQLARWKGAEVSATALPEDADYLRELGAQEIINYKTTSFESVVKDMDLVFDLIGGETQARSFTVLKEGGRLISTVEKPSDEAAAKHKIFAMVMQMKPTSKRLSQLTELLEEGKIKTCVDRTFALAQAKEAWRYMINCHTKGKIVFTV